MPTIPTITFEDMSAFLSERVTIEQCPCCSESEWSIDYVREDEDGNLVGALYGVTIAYEEGEMDYGSKRFVVISQHSAVRPVLMASCVNCGYIRSFSLGPFLEWLKKRGKPLRATDRPAAPEDTDAN